MKKSNKKFWIWKIVSIVILLAIEGYFIWLGEDIVLNNKTIRLWFIFSVPAWAIISSLLDLVFQKKTDD